MNKYKRTKKLKRTMVKSKKLEGFDLGMKNCEDFCRNDYMPEQHKVYRNVLNEKTMAKKHYKIRDDSLHLLCKSFHCDPKCNSFWKDDKQGRIDFEKKLKNGFLNTYSKKEVKMFQKKGAMSGCFNPKSKLNYDVFHK